MYTGNHREFAWALTAVGAFLLLFSVFAFAGWPGPADSCVGDLPNSCFCEVFAPPGLLQIKQPVNTFTNFSYIIVGLLILWALGDARAAGTTSGNPMRGPTALSVTYGALTIFLGPGSMLFHGSLTEWGGWFDQLSLVLFGGFLIYYDLIRIYRDRGTLKVLSLIGYLGVISVGILVILTLGKGSLLFGMLAILWLLLFQILVLTNNARGVQRKPYWFWMAVVSFVFATVVWLLSQTGGPLCAANNLLQGHGIWQLMTGLTTGFIFLYLRTESAS